MFSIAWERVKVVVSWVRTEFSKGLLLLSFLSLGSTALDLAVLGSVAVRDGRWEAVFQSSTGSNHGPWRHYYTNRLLGLPLECDDYNEFWFSVWGRGEGKFSMRQLIERIFNDSYLAILPAGLATCMRFKKTRFSYALACAVLHFGLVYCLYPLID